MHFLATRTKSLKNYFFTSGVVKNVFLCICAYFQTTRIMSLKKCFYTSGVVNNVFWCISTPSDSSPWKIVFGRLEWWITCFYAFPGQQNQVPKKLIFHVWGGQKRVFKHLRILPDHQNQVLKKIFFSPLKWLKTYFDAFPSHQNQVLYKLFFSRLGWLKTCFNEFAHTSIPPE